MLILQRKVGQKIVIGNIEIMVTEIGGRLGINKCRLGITAPRDVPIFRVELLHKDEGKS